MKMKKISVALLAAALCLSMPIGSAVAIAAGGDGPSKEDGVSSEPVTPVIGTKTDTQTVDGAQLDMIVSEDGKMAGKAEKGDQYLKSDKISDQNIAKAVAAVAKDKSSIVNKLESMGAIKTQGTVKDDQVVIIGTGDYKLVDKDGKPVDEKTFFNGQAKTLEFAIGSVDLKSGESVYALHLMANGQWEVLEGKYDKATGTVKLDMTSLSPITFFVAPSGAIKMPENTDPDQPTPEQPKPEQPTPEQPKPDQPTKPNQKPSSGSGSTSGTTSTTLIPGAAGDNALTSGTGTATVSGTRVSPHTGQK